MLRKRLGQVLVPGKHFVQHKVDHSLNGRKDPEGCVQQRQGGRERGAVGISVCVCVCAAVKRRAIRTVREGERERGERERHTHTHTHTHTHKHKHKPSCAARVLERDFRARAAGRLSSRVMACTRAADVTLGFNLHTAMPTQNPSAHVPGSRETQQAARNNNKQQEQSAASARFKPGGQRTHVWFLQSGTRNVCMRFDARRPRFASRSCSDSIADNSSSRPMSTRVSDTARSGGLAAQEGRRIGDKGGGEGQVGECAA